MHRSFAACKARPATLGPGHAGGAAVLEDLDPVRWAGRQAVVTLPEHIGVSNAGQVLDELLSVINRGATSLVADLTATISCDYAALTP